MKGVYSLILKVKENKEIGSLGEKKFNGIYVYVGSGQGPGGLKKRINRHLEVAKNKRDVRHWHIDYLLLGSELIGYCFGETEEDKECELANNLESEDKVKGFGCSDCRCGSHLFRIENDIELKIKKAFKETGLEPHFKRMG